MTRKNQPTREMVMKRSLVPILKPREVQVKTHQTQNQRKLKRSLSQQKSKRRRRLLQRRLKNKISPLILMTYWDWETLLLLHLHNKTIMEEGRHRHKEVLEE